MCVTNNDCPENQKCDSESGQCVPAGHPPGVPIKPKDETLTAKSENAPEA